MNSIYLRNIEDQILELSKIVADNLRPPLDKTISSWAEDSLELSPRVSRFSGPIDFSLTPYLIEPLNANKNSQRVVCIFGVQVGKTLMLQCILGYNIDQKPMPTMIVYPSQAVCKRRSRKHIIPFIQDNKVLANHLTENKDDLQLFEYRFDRMDAVLAWAGSESMLASEPIAVLLRDEFSKFDEGALTNSIARTTSYDWMARVFDVSTPKKKTDPGYIDFINGTQEYFFLPCPHCGHMQKLVFAQMIYPQRGTDESFASWTTRIKKETYYECISCKQKFNDVDKPSMLKKGKWIAENPDASYRSFQMASWYAIWVRFGKVAAEFVETKDNIDDLMNWINNRAGEFWEDRGENTDDDKILKHKLSYDKNIIPTDEPVILLMTVDVQKDYLVYLIRAHTYSKSYLIDYGTISVLDDIPSLMSKRMKNIKGEEYCTTFCLLDTGYRTLECYEYVLQTHGIIALKGDEGKQSMPVKWQNINKYPGTNKDLPNTVKLLHVDTIFFKEQLLLHINKGIDAEGNFDPSIADWYLHNETTKNYAQQLTAEIVVEETDNKGRIKRTWKKVRRENHYFDIEAYQLAGRYLIRDKLYELSQTTISTSSPSGRYYEQKAPEGWQ